MAGERDHAQTQTLDGFEQRRDFLGFAAVAHRQYDVLAHQHSEVAVNRLGRMQENRGRARARKRCGDFSTDQSRLPHPGDHHAALAAQQNFHGALETRVKPVKKRGERFGLDAQDAFRRIEAHCTLQPRTSAEICLSFPSSAGNSASGNAFVPSESALAGFSCTSRKIPSTPTAAPARASGSMNSGWPPLDFPSPPGSCTECVTSKTTGQPVFRMIGKERISTTRFW